MKGHKHSWSEWKQNEGVKYRECDICNTVEIYSEDGERTEVEGV